MSTKITFAEGPRTLLMGFCAQSDFNFFYCIAFFSWCWSKVTIAPKFYELPFSRKSQLKLRFLPILFTRRSEKRSKWSAPLPLKSRLRSRNQVVKPFISLFTFVLSLSLPLSLPLTSHYHTLPLSDCALLCIVFHLHENIVKRTKEGLDKRRDSAGFFREMLSALVRAEILREPHLTVSRFAGWIEWVKIATSIAICAKTVARRTLAQW